jgi:hypothetical protein
LPDKRHHYIRKLYLGAVRIALTDTAVVPYEKLSKPASFNSKCLIVGIRHGIRRFWVQDILPRLKSQPESTLWVCLYLRDSSTTCAVDYQQSMVWLVGTFLPGPDQWTHRPNEDLSFQTDSGGSGFLDGAGGEQDDQDANDKLDSHSSLLLYSV